MIAGYEPGCPLCRLTNDGEVLTRKLHEDSMIVVVDCLVCHTPMAVLKEHRDYFIADERDFIRKYFKNLIVDNFIPTSGEGDDLACLRKLLPEWNYSGPVRWVIDWEQRQIPKHPHCHLRPFPFPNTNRWEEL